MQQIHDGIAAGLIAGVARRQVDRDLAIGGVALEIAFERLAVHGDALDRSVVAAGFAPAPRPCADTIAAAPTSTITHASEFEVLTVIQPPNRRVILIPSARAISARYRGDLNVVYPQCRRLINPVSLAKVLWPPNASTVVRNSRPVLTTIP